MWRVSVHSFKNRSSSPSYSTIVSVMCLHILKNWKEIQDILLLKGLGFCFLMKIHKKNEFISIKKGSKTALKRWKSQKQDEILLWWSILLISFFCNLKLLMAKKFLCFTLLRYKENLFTPPHPFIIILFRCVVQRLYYGRRLW